MIRALRIVLDGLRGLLIGLAEIVPGVSGGTVALITGVYATLISSASNIIAGLLSGLRGHGRAMLALWASQPWRILIPVLAGMLVGIVIGAALLEPIMSEYPTHTRALFTGLILASLWIPAHMVGRAWDLRLLVVAVVATGASFVLTALPVITGGSESLWLVAPAAALAVCALVLPGVSGSFLLVILGMYEPTLQAVNSRDFAYLAGFALGALVGLGAFVRLLQFLLSHYRNLTLVVMTGLMAGSLRALWPWQGSKREILSIPADSFTVWLTLFVGVALVAALIAAERIWQRRGAPNFGVNRDAL